MGSECGRVFAVAVRRACIPPRFRSVAHVRPVGRDHALCGDEVGFGLLLDRTDVDGAVDVALHHRMGERDGHGRDTVVIGDG